MSTKPANAMRRAWFPLCSTLTAFALLASVAAAQPTPPQNSDTLLAQAQDDSRRPTRTKSRGPQRSRPQPAEPQPAEPQPQTPPDQQPAEEEMTDEQLQQEIQELLKNQPPGQDMDPAVQKRIEELLQRKARSAGRRAGEAPSEVQPIGQPNMQTPPQPADQPPPDQQNQADPNQPQPEQPARPSPRELARQRAEERRKQREQQQQQLGQQPGQQPGQAQPFQQQEVPPLPPPAQSFQPQPVDVPPSGPTTQINIPRDETESTPPEQRTYGFSIKNGTYEQLVEGFARQTGLGVMGEIPQGGTVNFITTEELTFKEALGRVQMLLFNYKPHEPYWILRNDENLQVIRVPDLYRIIPKERVFPSLDAYRAANLSEDEIALVFFTPKSGSIADLMIARNFLPDYVRITPLPDQNGVAIFALVRDIERYLDFVSLVSGTGGDARVMERIPLSNIPASDALNKLNQLMGPMDVGGQRIIRQPVTTQPTGLEGMTEPGVSIIADDEQNVLVVRAVQKTVDEIKRLLPYIDVSPSGEAPPPVIIPLKHTTADAIIPVIQQMLAANPGAVDAAVKAAPPDRRGRRSTGRISANVTPTATAVTTESVVLIPHPSGSALIVTANTEDDIDGVRKLVEMVDVPVIVEWVHIPITNADPDAVREGALEILGGGGPVPKQPGDPSGFQLFTDPTGTGIWFSGSEKDLDRVRAVVQKLDVATGAVTLHRIKLEYQTPTFVANMLREMEGTSAAAAAVAAPPATPDNKPPIRGGSRRGFQRSTAPAAPSKFTPDDPSGILYVICTEAEWGRYLSIIEQLDQPIDPNAPPFLRLPLEHVDAETAVEKLSNMIGANPDALSSEIRLVPANRSILVMGASERELEKLKVFLAEVDLPTAIEQRTFVIQHADPGEIKTLIEAFVTGTPEPEVRARRGRPARPNPQGDPNQPQPAVITAEPTIISPEMTIVQLGNKLIVRAAPVKLDEIAKLIEEFDLPGGGTEIRVYQDFPPSADIENIANTVESVVTGAAPGTRRGAPIPQPGGGTAAPSPKFIPQPNSGRLIVIATPTDFPRIEELLKVLRYEIKDEQFVVEFIPVDFVDPADLVEQIQPVLEIKVRGLLRSGELAEPGMTPIEDPSGVVPAPVAQRRRAGLPGGSGDRTSDKYHLSPDSRNKRIVVAAPKRIVEEVRTLIAQFDLEGGKSEIVFRTVELQNTAPAEMIQAVKEMMGKPQASRVNRVKRATGQSGAPAMPTPPAGGGETATGDSLTIVEAPGGGAIVLHGVLADVEQATEWIHKLDTMASTGRVIKAYKIDYGDVGKMFELIVNVVDSAPAPAPAGRGPSRPVRPKSEAEEEEEPAFQTSKTHTSGELYIHADLIGRMLLVAATQAKINQIEGVLNQFKEEEELVQATKPLPVPQEVIELTFADAEEAEYTFRDVIEVMWQGEERPQAQAAGFGNALIIKHPDESVFPKIRELIALHVDVPDQKKLETRRKMIATPQGARAALLAEFLKNNIPDIEVEVEDRTPKPEDIKKFNIQELQPRRPAGAPCVLPASFDQLSRGLLASVLTQSEEQPQEQPEPEPEETQEQEVLEEELEPEPEPVPPPRPSLQDRLIRERLQQNESAVVPINPPPAAPAETEGEKKERELDVSELYRGKKLRIIYNDQTGRLLLEGPDGIIEGIDDILDEFEETIKDQPVPPDIRIVQVEYIDVNSAADIIEEMFNATRQQRQEYQNLQRQQQMMQRQQQQMQQQQMRQAGQRGQEDEKQRQQQQQQQLQQPQMELPQLPPTSVRVYPNPRDRTLILRADTSQYEEIYKLLATIDQPKPFNSDMRVYPLKKLNVKEVETFLREALNLDQGGGAARRTARIGGGEFGEGGGGAISAPGSSLPRTILGRTSSGLNQLGIDPEDIDLFASEANNSIMVMAPPEALDYIGQIIDSLESGDIPNRLTKYYQLQHAAAQDVVDYLATHFGDATKGRAPRAEGPAAATSAGGGTANAATFIAYPQLNLITVQAIEPQIPEIEEIIKRLDVETGETWRDVRVNHVDAAVAADTLNQMFGGGAPGGAGRAPGGATAGSGRAQFIGEPGGNIIFFSAPQNLHQQILDNVAKLDRESEKQDQIRIIELQNAVPSIVAKAIDEAYADPGSPRRGGGAPAGKGFTITAHDPSRRLFVKASDTLFAEIESLVKSLDQPGDMPEFRIYPLEHANAKAVHAQMTKLLQEYVSRMKGELSEAFSVQVDETANALIVLGGPMVFGFLEENLRKIDTPAAGTGKVVSETITLQFNDAGEVAGNLQRMYQGRQLPEGVTPPQIEANRQNNTLIIRATADQIAEMRSTVIEPLEAAGPKSQGGIAPVETIRLTYADPASVADAIGRLFRSDGRNPRDVVTATPELGANALLVAAYPHMMQRVKDLIAQIDIEDAQDDGVHVVELRYADPESVARTLTEIYVNPARQRGGQQGPQLSVSAVPGSQAIVVRASDVEFKRISNTLQELDIEGVGIGEEVRMIPLQFSDANEVQAAVKEYLRKATGSQLAGDVRLTAMPQANAVMVAAKKEEVDRLERIIKNMDVAGEKGSVPQIIPLKYANAGMMATSLESMFSKPFGQTGRNYSPPVITADETGNFIIVRAMPADLASIEGLVARMDTEDKKDQTPYKIIQVPPGLNVDDLAERVETSINETAAARTAGLKGATTPKLTVIPDRRTNSITLAGSASLFGDAEEMIRLYSEMGPAGGIETRMMRVTNISPDEIEALIQQLTQPPGGDREGRSRRSGRQPGGSPGDGGGARRQRPGTGRP